MKAKSPENKVVTRVQELIYEMKVSQVMATKLITVNAKSRMSDLRSLLHDERISGVPVVDGERLIGLVSIEDFITCLADGDADCRVAERMSRDVKAVYDNDPLVYAVEMFELYDFGRFPVLDHRTDRLVGIITKGDIVRGLLNKVEIDYHQKEVEHAVRNHTFESLMTNGTVFTLQYDLIGGDFQRAGNTAGLIKKTLGRLGITPDILRRIGIAVYEAEMNTVIYTDGGHLIAQVVPNEIIIDVEDTGPGIQDIEKALKPGFSTAPDWVRELGFGAGMGLPNIQRCTDKMTLESEPGKGTRLRFSVELPEGVTE